MDIHKGEKQYPCNVCDKIFTNNTILNEHMEMHKREKPFKCSSCEYSFQNDTSLNEHMEMHKREKSFKCSSFEYSCNFYKRVLNLPPDTLTLSRQSGVCPG